MVPSPTPPPPASPSTLNLCTQLRERTNASGDVCGFAIGETRVFRRLCAGEGRRERGQIYARANRSSVRAACLAQVHCRRAINSAREPGTGLGQLGIAELAEAVKQEIKAFISRASTAGRSETHTCERVAACMCVCRRICEARSSYARFIAAYPIIRFL